MLTSSLLAYGRYRGVCYDANWEDKSEWYGTPASKKQIKKIQQLGFNSVSFTPFSYQPNIHEPLIRIRPKIDHGLMTDIERARRFHLHVILKPHIWSNQFWDGSGRWRGSIKMKTPQDWDRWFQNYEAMILHYARWAEESHMDLLVIGLEYVQATKGHAKEWIHIINEVRKIFNGPLTYAANGLEEARAIKFWDHLDFIGLNAYFPLAKTKTPTSRKLMESWANYSRILKKMSGAFKKKIILTEVGYSSADGTAQQPHRWPMRGDAFDTQEQAQCYDAMLTGLKNEEWLEGFFLWKYKVGITPPNQSREPSEAYFVFQNKPAEKVITRHLKE